MPEFSAGLDGLAGFDHAWLITWLDRAPEPEPDLHVVPFLLHGTGQRVGVFATRHPARPNPLGLSVVRILDVDGGMVWFRGVDLCDGTPVLDIKPWEQHLDVPGYPDADAIAAIRGGWYQTTGAANRPQRLPGGD
ncbi:MAG: tRNA (N6-threonylcarbamoyladenosine(37)-N6)-methyltransferase TrmO [Actinomycetota bacterium]|nr:tRNA (N6-threonylcarbamoyladenosine(37)-N6)-methyltransferase TrmO [Actinomycetota bacterium]